MTTAIIIFVMFAAVLSALNTKEEIKKALEDDADDKQRKENQ